MDTWTTAEQNNTLEKAKEDARLMSDYIWIEKGEWKQQKVRESWSYERKEMLWAREERREKVREKEKES